MLNRLANRLLDRIQRVDHQQVLNSGEAAPPPANLDQHLKAAAAGLLSDHFDPGSGLLDYSRLAGSAAYAEFRRLTRSLPGCDPLTLDGRQRQMAFWVNIYSALLIDSIIRFEVRGSILQQSRIFRRAAYRIAGLRFSAEVIEHGVLRANRPNPLTRLRALESNDRRAAYAPGEPDPRIHFALVCGARACPPIAFYSHQQLERQLDLASSNFINQGGARFDARQGDLLLSPIFRWYRADFGGRRGILEFIQRYSRDAALQDALNIGDLRMRFSNYDWRVNAVDASRSPADDRQLSVSGD